MIKQADTLTPDDQLQLIAHLAKKLRRCEIKQKLRRSVMEFMGIAPNLLGGMVWMLKNMSLQQTILVHN